ncbi:MAG: tRNA pseudouridine(55) synthase TruB [Rhizobiaceae bacterium]|nr:tRNA pseudouridine(55) synthase TruB [Rhizobiaceae bacterium]
MSRQRKKKGRPISGWVILDKPVGIGSTQCVGKVKWLYQAAKAGHAGTLDPLASGMLPLALGEATRTVPYIMDGQKTYRFTVTWGAETNTDDLEGEVTNSSETRPTKEEILAILPAYTGEIEQVPPKFSAIKIDGERAYKLARDGEEVEIKARKVTIETLELIDMTEDTATFETLCGKGTYVRALARDFGRDLKCFGHITELRRVSVGPFLEEDLVPLERLVGLEGDLEALDAELFTTGTALDDVPEVPLTKEQVHRVRMGNAIVLRGRDAIVHAPEVFASSGNELIAIGEVDRGQFKPKRVFQHSYV